jgi:hypothetical protein
MSDHGMEPSSSGTATRCRKPLDNGFPLLGRQRWRPEPAALLLVFCKKPFNLAFRYLPGLTMLQPSGSVRILKQSKQQ